MNRRPLLLATAGGLFLPGILRAQDAAGIGTAARPCRVGVTSGVHAQVLEQVRDVLARDNFVVRITEFDTLVIIAFCKPMMKHSSTTVMISDEPMTRW